MSISYNTFSASTTTSAQKSDAARMKDVASEAARNLQVDTNKLSAQVTGRDVGGDSNPFEMDKWNVFTAFDLQIVEQQQPGIERFDDADCGPTGCGTTSGETDCGPSGCGTTSGDTDCGPSGCGTTSGDTDCGPSGCGTTSGDTDCGPSGCGTTSGDTDCGPSGCGTTSGDTDCGPSGCGTTSGDTDCGPSGCGTTSGSDRGYGIRTHDLTREATLHRQLDVQLQLDIQIKQKSFKQF